MSLPVTLVLTVLWGGFVAAESTAFLQLLISQPLIAGAVTGALWGRLDLGLELGSLLQLYACGTLPLGGRTPEDFPTGTVVGVAVAAALANVLPAWTSAGAPLLYGLGAAFLVALVGRSLTVWLRRRNEGIAHWAESELAAGRLGALGRAQWAGVGQAFALGSAYVGLCLLGFALVGRALLESHGLAFARAWQSGSPWLWGFGAGIVTRGFVRGRRPGLLFWFSLVSFLMVRLVTAP